MNLRKSILALSVVAGIVAAPMTGINVRHVMYIITNNV